MNRASGELGVAKNEPKTDQRELGAAKSRNRACDLSAAKSKAATHNPARHPAGFSGLRICKNIKNSKLGKI
ncbi:MAG: hypothetical protein ACFB0B_13035 [Thermonemataceae bacterium]